MNERRLAQRRRALKSAHIILSDHAPKLPCTLRNVSEIGALLEVSTTFGIPESFDVIIDGERKPCRSVWRTETKIGIAFG